MIAQPMYTLLGHYIYAELEKYASSECVVHLHIYGSKCEPNVLCFNSTILMYCTDRHVWVPRSYMGVHYSKIAR